MGPKPVTLATMMPDLAHQFWYIFSVSFCRKTEEKVLTQVEAVQKVIRRIGDGHLEIKATAVEDVQAMRTMGREEVIASLRA